MSLCELSNTIWEDLGSPQAISTTSIQNWLIYNIGKLNTATYNCYSAIGTTGISPEMGSEEESIYTEIYKTNYYGRKILEVLTAGGGSILWTSMTEGDSNIKRVSPAEAAKVFKDLKRDSEAQLRIQINDYIKGKSGAQSSNYFTIQNNPNQIGNPRYYGPAR